MKSTRKSVKHSLLISAAALVLSIAMLIGTTFAWFTDSVTSGVNKIQAGNLDINVEYNVLNSDGSLSEHWESLENSTSLFSKNLWEPGHTEYAVLRIKNDGTLALKYTATVTADNEVKSNSVLSTDPNDKFKLSTYLKYGATITDTPTSFTKREDATALADTAIGSNAYADRPLAASGNDHDCEYLTLVVTMPTTVGNEANYKKGADVPSVDLGVTITATQNTVENDSFDNQYDKDAPYETVNVSNETELRTALHNAPLNGSGVRIVLQNDITLNMYYSSLIFAHSNTADKWQHGGGLTAEAAAIEASKPENNELPDYSTDYDTLAHYKIAVNGWDTVSTDLTEQAKFGANFPMSAANPVSRLVVKSGQNVIIDLNGKTIAKRTDATHGSYSNCDTDIIGNFGTLSIVDSASNGKVVGRGYTSCSGAVLHNYASGIMTIGNIAVDGNAQGFAEKTGQYVVRNEGGQITIDGANIYDPESTSASLLCNDSGSMTIKNATLNHPHTKTVNCKGGKIVVESANITSDKYAIYAAGGTVEVTDASVTITASNTSATAGTMLEKGGNITHK